MHDDKLLKVKNPAYGATLSLAPGIEWWFGNRVAAFAELGYSGHFFAHDTIPHGQTHFAASQVLLTFGATFALSEPEQDRPRRDPEADDRRARRYFSSGKEAYDNGLYKRALGSFSDAYDLSPRPLMLYNIAKTEDKLGQAEAARDHYRRFLAAVPSSAQHGEVQSRVTVLDAQLGGTPAPATAPAPVPLDVTDLLDGEVTDTHSDKTPVRSERVYKQWWFWTAVGAVVAGSVTGALVAGLRNGAHEPAH